jgi:lipopolysaccharide export LptBFGC system permease protein LptF
MNRLSMHIMKRMIVNFIVLFMLFYLLGAVIDIIVNLDEFDKFAAKMSEDSGVLTRIYTIIRIIIGFECPRLFQVFAYLHGVIAVGAMAFTAASMSKSREFVAIMAVGVSLRRVALPYLLVMAGISGVALLNQDYMLPRVAPLLLRDRAQLGDRSVGSFPVPFTPDQQGSLLFAPSLDPETGILSEPSILLRDEKGRMIKQIRATSAIWNSETNDGWFLIDGLSVDISYDEETSQAAIMAPVAIDYYATELSPHILTIHRFGQYIGMLGMSQLNSMLEVAGAFDAPMLRRHLYSRFASITLNLLAMVIVIPFFVTRETINFSRQAILCGVTAMTILFGGTVLMLMPMEGIPAIVSVFLPSIVLLPVALMRIVSIRT